VDERDLWIATAAEFFGPFALCAIGIGSIISTQSLAGGSNLIVVALAHGLAIGLMIAALGHVSGGHFNPAVTISMLATGQITVTRAVSYIVAQLIGGAAGAGILTVIFPDLGELGRNNVGVNLGLPALGPDITITGAVIMEIMLTFFLVLVIWGSAVDPRVPRGLAPLSIGLTITMDILAGGRVSGAAMNPARWFGPAIVQQDFTNWWIWIVGPIVGGLIAGIAYKSVWLPKGPLAEAAARRDAVDVEAPSTPVQRAQIRRRSSRRR
jgi:aquaporin TIP